MPNHPKQTEAAYFALEKCLRSLQTLAARAGEVININVEITCNKDV
jgi:hypothetical protein